MKKLTLLVAFFVCAIGFSQQVTSLSDWAEQNPQTQTQKVTVEKSRAADASTNASTMGTNNPTYVQAIYVSNGGSADASTNVSTMGTNSPVDYRQVTPNTNSHVRTNFDPTSFTSEDVRGVNVNIGDAGTATRTANSENYSVYAVTITHSNTQTIEAGAEIACASPTSYRNNSIFRDFDLSGDFGITDDFVVTDAEIAIGAGVITPNGFPLVVNVYSTTTGTFPGGVLTLQGTGMVTITAADSETMVSVPVSATIPAGESMIYEVLIVDDGTDTNFMRFGANNDGQTGPSYIMALDCGAPDPIDMAVAFGLGNSFVMNIIGDVATGGGADCSASNPSNAFENGRGNNAGNGWTVATDMIVPMGSDMMLNQVTTFEFMTAGGATVVSADIVIYGDNAGIPDAGNVIASETLAPTSNTVVGSNFGFDISEVVFDITPVALAGDAGMDMTYWVAVQVTTSDGATAFWENSTASMVGNPQAFDDGTGWIIPDTTQDSVYVFSADCSPIGGGGADCSASNPSNAFENGRGNNAGNGWTVATDMIVPMGSDMMLNQVTTFEFMTAGGATVVSADIVIYGDNAGIPDAGNVISTETLAPTSNTVVGSNFGFDISEVVFDITPVALAGNAGMDMTYWVAVQVTTSDGATAFWENSTASMVGNPQAFDDGTGWIIPDATQESVYVFSADCSPIGGGGNDCSASNPSNAFENGRGNNAGNGWTIATDMIVPTGSDMMLNQVTTFEFMTAGGATVVSADITIYGDNAGIPDTGNVISTETLAPTSNTVVGSNFGFDVSEVVFDITPVALAGDAGMDVTYWVAVQVTTSDGAVAFWENSTASMVGNPQAFDDGTGWIIPDATQESVYVFTADCSDIVLPPDPINDFCTGAIPVSCGESVTGTTIDATIDTDVAPDCDTAVTSPGVWYTFTDASGLVSDITITMCSGNGTADFDTKLSVYTGDCGAPPLTCVVGNDDTCGLQSEVSFQSDGVTTYYILVHAFGGATGNFTFDVNCIPVPPPNDLIVNSIDVDEIGFPYTDPSVAMPAATTEGGNPVGCDLDGANGVWYNFTAGGDGWATAEIITPGGTSAVTIYTAPNENAIETDLTLVDHPENQCLPGTYASINTVAGQAYYVFVLNTGAVTDIVITGNNLSTSDNTIEGFSFSPNPSSSIINLSALDNIETVVLYNVLGQKVIDQTINATTSQVNVSNLTTGTYFMKVSVNGVIGTYKVLKN